MLNYSTIFFFWLWRQLIRKEWTASLRFYNHKEFHWHNASKFQQLHNFLLMETSNVQKLPLRDSYREISCVVSNPLTYVVHNIILVLIWVSWSMETSSIVKFFYLNLLVSIETKVTARKETPHLVHRTHFDFIFQLFPFN